MYEKERRVVIHTDSNTTQNICDFVGSSGEVRISNTVAQLYPKLSLE